MFINIFKKKIIININNKNTKIRWNKGIWEVDFLERNLNDFWFRNIT